MLVNLGYSAELYTAKLSRDNAAPREQLAGLTCAKMFSWGQALRYHGDLIEDPSGTS